MHTPFYHSFLLKICPFVHAVSYGDFHRCCIINALIIGYSSSSAAAQIAGVVSAEEKQLPALSLRKALATLPEDSTPEASIIRGGCNL